MHENLFNSYTFSILFAVGTSLGNFTCALFGWFGFTWSRAIVQSIIATILFLLITTIGKTFES